MRIIWDPTEYRFLAELTPGELWREDMESVKAAGFKTTGPPSWQWYCFKAKPLNKLRENRPKSGLVLTELALEKYKQINDREEQKAALKKEFQQADKAAKKASKDSEISGTTELIIPEGKIWISREDLPPGKPFVWTYVRPEPPKELCMICDSPLYSIYEHPLICLWCEKELDNQKQNHHTMEISQG